MSDIVEIKLLVGLHIDNAFIKHVFLKPITGLLELKLIEIYESPLPVPQKVTAMIFESTLSIGDRIMTEKIARQLCLPDRQIIILNITNIKRD